ncbi:cardiolipin synthase [Mergibacter septicus]|uniref:cardiolipin synthase n=1 Tax=Mergibacter septicus TaxID=221402 RepID=UPI001178D840|nr:cardiolipin synthase [Mergibacter septicus]AWX13383.1 cardiolipin synthase [Mergibacter septicus]
MFLIILHICLIILFTSRILWRNDLDPIARLAWFAVLMLLPYIGIAIYWLFGENNIGKEASAKYKAFFQQFKQRYPTLISTINYSPAQKLIELPYQPAFNYASSINGFHTLSGNSAELMPDAQLARQRLIKDIQQAKDSVHILYYIWLEDHTGITVAQALIDAAKRGVTCRVMVDGLGSRLFIKSSYWQQMEQAGIQLAVAFSLKNPIKTILTSRLDLRNHRKITLIDNKIVYCGSQNCADPEFRIKPKFAPWVDILLRFEGGVVQQMQLLFFSDWLVATGENLIPLEFQPQPFKIQDKGILAQVVGDGPTERKNASPQLFATLFSVAREQIILSTPYFVPDPMTIESLCAAALRGIKVTIIFPKYNDSWIVSAASRSHYFALLNAGVTIYEYKLGLLHAKTLTIDNKVSFIGSTNLDLRSFNLNYENNILLQDEKTTTAIYQRQLDYISQSELVTLTQIINQPIWKQIWQNVIATLGPVL